jgi:hypothetical protein
MRKDNKKAEAVSYCRMILVGKRNDRLRDIILVGRYVQSF